MWLIYEWENGQKTEEGGVGRMEEMRGENGRAEERREEEAVGLGRIIFHWARPRQPEQQD